MQNKPSLSFRAKLVLVVLASSVALVQGKSLDSSRRADVAAGSDKREDPLIALPSEHLQPQLAGPYAQPQIHYVVHQEPQQSHPEPSHQQAAELGGQSEQPKQEVSYVLVKSEGGSGQVQPDTPVEEDCNQRERAEYVVAPEADQGQVSAGRQDYPGEIIYVGQSGDARHSANNQQEQEGLASVVQGSGVPATILTEVPLKDMPYEVLEKLKRDYGVKVVATRERPGANLVINCDDYTGQGQTICSRQTSLGSMQANGIYATSFTNSPADDQSVAQLPRESTAEIESTSAAGLDNTEPQAGTYTTRDGQTRVVGTDSQEYRERFGTRTYVALEQAEPVHAETPEEASSPAEENAGEKAEVQPEGEKHDSGFEVQPETSAENHTEAGELTDKSSR